jgi:hypothetical protein
MLALGAGVAVVPHTARPPVELSFVRHSATSATPVVQLTNRTESAIICEVPGGRDVGDSHGRVMFFYAPEGECLVSMSRHAACQVEVWAKRSVSIRVHAEPSDRRQKIEALLRKVGIYIASTGFVSTVTLPPR